MKVESRRLEAFLIPVILSTLFLTGCKILEPDPGTIKFRMEKKDVSLGVYVDDEFLGDLYHENQEISNEVSKGKHSYHFFENDHRLKSIHYFFDISSKETKTLFIGIGEDHIVWEDYVPKAGELNEFVQSIASE